VLELTGLLARVPAFREFMTLEELGASSRALVAEFPGLARLETVGASAEGRPIELLTIGHGAKPALLVGVPHPNEPIGTLTLEFLCRLLCEDGDLRARLDATVYAVKVADPDGFVLNQGWFKGQFSPLRYALDYYRPPHREQVEWSFPVEYKTLRFATPSPETAAVMRVMERVRRASSTRCTMRASAGSTSMPRTSGRRRLAPAGGEPGPPPPPRRARGALPAHARARRVRPVRGRRDL